MSTTPFNSYCPPEANYGDRTHSDSTATFPESVPNSRFPLCLHTVGLSNLRVIAETSAPGRDFKIKSVNLREENGFAFTLVTRYNREMSRPATTNPV